MEFKCWLPALISSAKLEACRKSLRRRLAGKHLSSLDPTTNQGYKLYLTLCPPMHVSAGVSGNKSLRDPIPDGLGMRLSDGGTVSYNMPVFMCLILLLLTIRR